MVMAYLVNYNVVQLCIRYTNNIKRYTNITMWTGFIAMKLSTAAKLYLNITLICFLNICVPFPKAIQNKGWGHSQNLIWFII